MSDICDKSFPSIGFLSVVESPQHGLFGGYLVLAPTGRPLEFHCTEPIKPSRAQEILYGPTLDAYLYGEQLGQALLSSTKKKPPVVFVETRPMLAVREFVSIPIIRVVRKRDKVSSDKSSTEERQDPYQFEAPTPCPAGLLSAIQTLGKRIDLAEPFDRIREAISEAQRGSHRRAA